MEQEQLSNQLELCGVEQQDNENLMNIASSLSIKIKQNQDDIVRVYRKPVRKTADKKTEKTDKPTNPPIIIILREGCKNRWLESSKEFNQDAPLTTKDVGIEKDSPIYLRECLTPTTAYLLYKARTELRGKVPELCKYVWVKNGILLARRREKEKTHTIRNIADIEKLVAEFSAT